MHRTTKYPSVPAHPTCRARQARLARQVSTTPSTLDGVVGWLFALSDVKHDHRLPLERSRRAFSAPSLRRWDSITAMSAARKMTAVGATFGCLVAALAPMVQATLVSGRQVRAVARCDAHRAYRRTRSVLVFRTGSARMTYFACARPNGKPVLLAMTYQTSSTRSQLQSLVISTPYVATIQRQTSARRTLPPCDKNTINQPCCDPTPQQSCTATTVQDLVSIANASRRTRLDLDGQPSPLGRLVLSSAGGAAWLAPSSIASHADQALVAVAVDPLARRGLTDCPYEDPKQLDSGTVSHLTIDGLKVKWLNAGQPRSAKLSPRGRDVEAVC